MTKCAESGGDAFAAAKFQPDGEHVADDGEERGQGGVEDKSGEEAGRTVRHGICEIGMRRRAVD